jgi:hypothetical protein
MRPCFDAGPKYFQTVQHAGPGRVLAKTRTKGGKSHQAIRRIQTELKVFGSSPMDLYRGTDAIRNGSSK